MLRVGGRGRLPKLFGFVLSSPYVLFKIDITKIQTFKYRCYDSDIENREVEYTLHNES